jgi:dethiobiotin synthetase
MKTIFVTGTDTGVGKTAISASLAAFLSLRKGMDVGVMKPFETGLRKGDRNLPPRDAVYLKKASGSADDLADICPYTFEAPLAPDIAANLENVKIELSVLDRTYKKIVKRHDVVIIEGAGGIMVPIKKNFFYADLIERWKAPVIIVGRLTTGTINHTLLTYDCLRSRNIAVMGLVLNNHDKTKNIAARTNLEVLKYYFKAPVLGALPYIEDLLSKGIDREFQADIFSKYIDTEILLQRIADTE